MSHISTGTVLIKDLDSLAQVCRSLGLELQRGEKQYRTYAGRQTKCDHRIVDPNNPKAYQIGLLPAKFDKQTQKLVESSTGKDGWMLGYDSWAGGDGMMDKVGQGCQGLMQSYGVQTAKAKATQMGWGVREEKLPDGSVRMVLTPQTKAQQHAVNW